MHPIMKNWKKIDADVFWGEIAASDHVLQIYENDDSFLNALAGFVGGGINAGDCVIVIATEAHLNALNHQLLSYGVHVQTLINDERYFPLNAEVTLSRFMVNGWPDETLFTQTVGSLIAKARNRGRRIRAFDEMVAILWAQGHNGATVQLEALWNNFMKKEDFCLFCAYPKIGFTQNIQESIQHICNCHSKLINGTEKQLTEVVYSSL